MRISCSLKKNHIPVVDYLTVGDPLVVTAEAFAGRLDVTLSVNEGQGFQLIGVATPSLQDAYPLPFYANRFAMLPPRCMLAISFDQYGYTVYFCLSHEDLFATLEAKEGRVKLCLEREVSVSAEAKRAVLVCVRGAVLDTVLQESLEIALYESGAHGRLSFEKSVLPNWLQGLGWESGLAFGSDLTHEKIVESVRSLVSSGQHLSYVLISLGWQEATYLSTDPYRAPSLRSFNADRTRFPRDLIGVVADLEALGVKYVGISHEIMGLQGGIHPDLARRYDLPMNQKEHYFLGSDLGTTFQFYYDFYAYLREMRISFVKVMRQQDVFNYADAGIHPTVLCRNLQAAIQAASMIQFNLAPLNGECLYNANLFYWAASQVSNLAPALEWKQTLGVFKGIRNRLVNLLWLKYLMIPDGGGWMSFGTQAESFAIMQACIGGVTMISDPAGSKHNDQILRKLALTNGMILQPDRALTLCRESLFKDPLEDGKIYKACTQKGKSYFLVLFNFTQEKEEMAVQIAGEEIDEIEGERFAVFSHRRGFLGLFGKSDPITLVLRPQQSDIVTFVPLEKGIAVWGCFRYFLAPGPIEDVQLDEESLNISSKIGAEIVLYCDRAVLEVRRNGAVIPWEYNSQEKTLKIDSRQSQVNVSCNYVIDFES